MKLLGVQFLVGLMFLLNYSSGRPSFRRYNYNRYMRKISASVEKIEVEMLGSIFKRHVQQLRHTPNKQVELVFLIDSSGTVGQTYFYQEVQFVRNLLADFTVDINTTRVSVITYSSPNKIHRYVDYMTYPHQDKHKCRLLHEDINEIIYTPGGTYTLGALREAEKVLRSARPNATKAIFLMTDGYSNGGDPRPIAHKLKRQGVKIFTFGIRNGFRWELEAIASHPKNETCYILESFEEFEALAKRALHTDLQSGTYISQSVSKCGKLCNSRDKCCHDDATCTCGTYTGKYDCLCDPGFYGTGRGKTGCKPCPPGTYKNFTGQGGRSLCLACPDENQITPLAAKSERQCVCKRGYRSFGSQACTVARCPELSPPERGYFINSKCNNVFNAACGLRCNSGYELHGSSLRICQEDGTWSGQTANCVMKTCPALSQPKNGLMICTTDDFAYSTVCRFSCNSGYRLVGSRKRTCLAIAFWTGIATRCREVTCPQLVEIKDGLITPPSCVLSEVVFGTVCSVTCSSGYTLMGPHTKQCKPDGTWMETKGGVNQCIDKSPPFLHCPNDIEVMADEEEETTQIDWREPVPVDNSGLIPVLTTEPAVTSGSRFPIGITTITYRAEDLSKNVAKCQFEINVVDKTAPRVDKCPTPAKIVSKQKMTEVSLESPEFSDNSGHTVDFASSWKSTDLFPLGTTRVMYTASDASNNTNTCEVDVTIYPHLCVSPQPPNNGNVTCEEDESNVRCNISCMDGFTFIDQVAQEYICDLEQGEWTPEELFPFPDCAVTEESNDIFQPATVTMTGDISCEDQKSLLEIAENLEEEMKEKLSDLCNDKGLSCSLSSLKSVCEDDEDFNKISSIGSRNRKKRHLLIQRRSKRSILESSAERLMEEQGNKTKKSRISFDITLKGSGVKTKETREKMEDHFTNALKNLLSSMKTKSKTILATKDKPMKIDHMSYDVDKAKAEYKCPEGSILTDGKCKYCPVGMFHNAERKMCEDCRQGTYQDNEGQTTCIRCPDDMSTEKQHARSVKECKAICKPGTFSLNGLEPCETCHQGYYQADYSARSCLPCIDGKTTQRRGSSSNEKCAELCPPGYASKSGLAPCLPCPPQAYQAKSGQTECLVCPGGGTTGIRGAASLSLCIMPPDSWEIQSDGAAEGSVQFNDCDFDNPCQNGGVCKKGEGTLYTCQCKDGFGGETCKEVIDLCKSDPCLNNGVCLSTNGAVKCTCSAGFIGETCETNVDDCVLGMCQNGGTCIDGVESHTCECLPGFSGVDCEIRIDGCELDQCMNNGVCKSSSSGSSCDCPPGFAGQRCEVDEDECLDLPCLNDATCIDLPGDFRCECQEGYTGKTCNVNVDDCAPSNPCQNGGLCVDGVNGYTCNCPEQFDGQRCEEEITPYYQLDFVNPSIMDYGRMSIDRPLESVSASMWIKTTDTENQGTPFSYGVKGQPDAFTITDYGNLNLYINGAATSVTRALNNGQWRHLVLTWTIQKGEWKCYIDGLLVDQGYDVSPSKAIPGKGVFIIGQEQDSQGGDFSPGETFVGSLTQLNVWDRELTIEEVDRLRFKCEEFHGNVIAWPDVKASLRGDLTATPSRFCQDMRYRYRNWRDMLNMINSYKS